jgi:hypothetical protein
VQEVHLDKTVTLLDSPGVVFADAGAEGAAAAALRNAVKAEQLPDPTLPVSSAGQSSADRPASCIARLPGLMLLPRLLAGSGRILHQILLLPCPVLPD